MLNQKCDKSDSWETGLSFVSLCFGLGSFSCLNLLLCIIINQYNCKYDATSTDVTALCRIFNPSTALDVPRGSHWTKLKCVNLRGTSYIRSLCSFLYSKWKVSMRLMNSPHLKHSPLMTNIFPGTTLDVLLQ